MACASPELCKEICGSEAGCTNMAFIKLVTELMPVGLRYSITCCTNMTFVKLVTELMKVDLMYYRLHAPTWPSSSWSRSSCQLVQTMAKI